MKDHFVPGIVLSGVLYGQNGRTRQGRAIFPARVRTQANTWFASSCAPILYSLMIYKISFKRRVNNVTIWLKHGKVNIEGFQQPKITRENTSFNLFIHFYVDRSYQFDSFKQRLFSLEYKACLLRGLANSSDTRRVTGDEAQGHMRRMKKNKIKNNWIKLNIQFCISPLTIDSHLHQPLDNGCKK